MDPFFDNPGKWSFKQCPNGGCGLVWLDPTPVAEDLHLAYREYFTHGDRDGGVSATARLRSVLYGGYKAVTALPGAAIGLGKSKWQMENMFLNDLSPGKLLDVGCGDGLFLNRMRMRGWKVEGVDFDPNAVANAKSKYGLDLRLGDLASAGFAGDTFDAVSLKHVIEHVPDPVGLLGEVRRILKRGGRTVVATPNSESLGHRELGIFWFGLDQPRHLQIFSVPALEKCARRAGLEVERALSTAANADTFIGGSCGIRDAKDHKSEYFPPPNFRRTLKAVSTQYREHLALRVDPHCGEEAVVIATKN